MSPALANRLEFARKGGVKRLLRIGSRGSALALAQARAVQRRLRSRFPGWGFPVVVVRTTGDEFQSAALFKKKNIGVFTKKLEQKLLQKEIDLAVHSLKDLPTEVPKGLVLAAVTRRLDVRDVLFSRGAYDLRSLPKGAVVGTGSPRRKCQLLRWRPDLKLRDLRGNLDTRVAKVLGKKGLDAIVVARAGLLRLRKYRRYCRVLSPVRMLPAVGQAALGIQVRRDDGLARRAAAALDHRLTRQAVSAERAFLRVLRGGCRVPMGVRSQAKGRRLYLRGAVFSPRGRGWIDGEAAGPLGQAEKVGSRLAKKLLAAGAGRFLREARA